MLYVTTRTTFGNSARTPPADPTTITKHATARTTRHISFFVGSVVPSQFITRSSPPPPAHSSQPQTLIQRLLRFRVLLAANGHATLIPRCPVELRRTRVGILPCRWPLDR